MKNYKLSIPKPCHEDWNKMAPNEQGKFCKSCAKTVVDFTNKTTQEIQNYFIENKNERVCGHFYRKQLSSIVIQLPETTFLKPLSFQKIFFLSLLFAMGSTLFSCKTDTGKIQKIEKVEIIDSVIKIEKTVDSLLVKNDSIVKNKELKKMITPPPPSVEGIVIIETTGELQIEEPIKIDDLKEVDEDEINDI